MKNYTNILNEGFNSYFKKLNESKFDEFENMTKEPIFEFPNGEYFYIGVDKEKETMYAGHATNNGIIREFEIDYDFDDTLDGNLNRLYEYIIDEKPELMDEPIEESCKSKKTFKESIEDFEGAKKIDTIIGVAIDDDRIQSRDAWEKYDFYQGDIIFDGEHFDVGEKYSVDVYELPKKYWDDYGMTEDSHVYMVVNHKIEESCKSKKKKGLNEEGEELPIDYLADDLRSDVYNALSDIAFKYHKEGVDLTEDDMDKAIEWFQMRFWEDEGLEESCKFKKNKKLKESLSATDLVRDIYSKFKEAEFIDERDLGENIGLIFDISKIKNKNAIKEYLKELEVKIAKNNPNKIMIIAKEDEDDIEESCKSNRKLDEAVPRDLMKSIKYTSKYRRNQGYDDSLDYASADMKEITAEDVMKMKKNGEDLSDIYVLSDSGLTQLDKDGHPSEWGSTYVGRANQSLNKTLSNATKIYKGKIDYFSNTQPDKYAERVGDEDTDWYGKREHNKRLGKGRSGNKGKDFRKAFEKAGTEIKKLRKAYEDGDISRNEMESKIADLKAQREYKSYDANSYNRSKQMRADARYYDSNKAARKNVDAYEEAKDALDWAKYKLEDNKEKLVKAQAGTGAGNKRVADLKKKIASLQRDLAYYEKELASDPVQQELDDLQEYIDKATQEIDDNQKVIDKLLRRN